MEDSKRIYEEPAVEMVVLGQDDVIVASGGDSVDLGENETDIMPPTNY